VVLQSAGTGTGTLLKWISTLLGGVVVLVAGLAWFVTPLAENALDEYMAAQRSRSEFELVNPGAFHAYDRGRRVTYSEAISDDRRVLREVFISQRLDNGVQVNVWAETGTQRLDPISGSQYLVLHNGRRYEVSASGADMRIMEFTQLRQRIETSAVRPNRRDAEAMPTWSLGDDAKSRAELHWRLALPIFATIGGLLGVGVSRVRPRQGRFAKIVPAMLIMMAYYLALLINRNAIAEHQVPAALGMWTVHAGFLGLAGAMLHRLSRPVMD